MHTSAEQRENAFQERISKNSIVLANAARELLAGDAGAGLIQAALRCWEQDYGRGSALILARTALIGVSSELEQRLQSQV